MERITKRMSQNNHRPILFSLGVLLLGVVLLSSCISHKSNAYVSDPQPKYIEDGTVFDATTSSDAIYTNPQVEPSFPGGTQGLNKFLAENIKYPYNALDNSITGTVRVSFIIEKDSSLSNITMLHDIGGSCGAEVVRIIRLMPKWIPAKQDGKAVRSQFNLPVKFDLR